MCVRVNEIQETWKENERLFDAAFVIREWSYGLLKD